MKVRRTFPKHRRIDITLAPKSENRSSAPTRRVSAGDPFIYPVARNKLNLNWLNQRTEESRPNEGAVVSAAIDRAK